MGILETILPSSLVEPLVSSPPPALDWSMVIWDMPSARACTPPSSFPSLLMSPSALEAGALSGVGIVDVTDSSLSATDVDEISSPLDAL